MNINTELTREKIQSIVQRWQQLKLQFGDQAINVPEYAQLLKIIKHMQSNKEEPIIGESAFTALQLNLLKSQVQAFKFLQKLVSSSSQPIPQVLVDFVSNDRNAFASGPYLPLTVPVQQNTGPGPTSQIPSQSHGQGLGLTLQASNGVADVNIPSGFPMSLGASTLGTLLAQVSQSVSQQSALSNQFGLGQIGQNIGQPAMGQIKNGNDVVASTSNFPPQEIPSPVSTPISVGTPEFKSNYSPIKVSTPDEDDTTKRGIKPILLEPHPPTKSDNIIKLELEQLVIPITDPNIKVDCFEIPKVFDKQVEFKALYDKDSKIQYPSILPNGINAEEIFDNRRILMYLNIENKIDLLQSKLKTESLTEREAVELSKLQLLPLQKQLRGRILAQTWFSKSCLPNSHPNFLAKFGVLSLDNANQSHELYRHQMLTLLQVQNQKHQKTIHQILITRESQTNITNRRRERLLRFATKVNSLHNQTAKEEQKRLERMAKQRLQALKSNDEEAYLKLLDHTKDTRITHLLKQTNQFLDSLAQAVQSQQNDANNKKKIANDEPLVEEDPDEKREKLDYYHVAHRIKEEVNAQPKMLIGGTLKEYQVKGLQWMVSLYNNHLNGILADEMGLGKTIQTLSLLTYLIETKKVNGPFLVIVPLSTLTNWNLEFEKWAPTVRKITYKGTPNQRKVLQQEIRSGNFQILLTTFEYIIKDKALLSRIKWVHMIIDEGHRMKNANSKLSETLTHNYHSDYRLILTGTPLQNNLPELWALLNFVLPKIFNSVKSFDEWFNTPFANTGGQDKIELTEEETLLVIRRLHKVLRPFLLRRLKKDVEKDLPNKVEKVVKCKMSSLQSKLYQQMLRFNILYASHPSDGVTPVIIKNANNQIMQLRKICNHPFVYEEVENLINPKSENNDQIWRVAGKFELLDKVLPKFKATGHRVLIFFQMTQIMDIMEDFLRFRGLKYMRLDGSTKADDRTDLLKLFNAPNSDYFCFLLSTRAGGLGLNLQTADTVIIFDTDWNPHQDLQAQDRAHRIGQKNEVRILRLITEDSVEEMILDRAHAKLEIDGKVIQAGKFDQKSTAEEQEAMLRALFEKEDERKLKGNNRTSDDEDELDDDELNQVIARNDDELIMFRQMDEARLIDTRNAPYPSRLYTEQELPEVYKLDPADVIKKDEIDIDDYGRGSRERKAMTYDDNLSEEQWLKKIEGVESDGNGSDSDSGIRPRRTKGKIGLRLDDLDEELNSFDPDDDFLGSKRQNFDYGMDLPGMGSFKKQKNNIPRGFARGRGSRGRGRGGNLNNRSTPQPDPLDPQQRALLRNVLLIIYETVVNYKNLEGRLLSDIFAVKPPRKLYPDYYVLIKSPIALDMIKKRITSKVYVRPREFLEDLHLMFSNARIYNEEHSVVYQDASTLELVAMNKFRELSSNLSPIEVESILDFSEFDDIYGLKPLIVGSAVKYPIQVDLDSLDLPLADFDLDLDGDTNFD